MEGDFKDGIELNTNKYNQFDIQLDDKSEFYSYHDIVVHVPHMVDVHADLRAVVGHTGGGGRAVPWVTTRGEFKVGAVWFPVQGSTTILYNLIKHQLSESLHHPLR